MVNVMLTKCVRNIGSIFNDVDHVMVNFRNLVTNTNYDNNYLEQIVWVKLKGP